jgi:hypothetical protein
MRKISMTLAVALLTASLQCVAACSVLPCDERAKAPAPVEDCHHRAPDSNGEQGNHDESSCGHQTFISEAAPQPSSVVFDAMQVAVIPAVHRWQPRLVPVAEVAHDWSPPLRPLSASTTVLRL